MKTDRLMQTAVLLAVASVLGLVFACTQPGQSSTQSVVGTWRQDVNYDSSIIPVPTPPSTTPNPSQFRYQFQFNSDNSFELDVSAIPSGQTQYVLFIGQRGTYAIDGEIITVTITSAYQITDEQTLTGSWTSTSDSGKGKYSVSGTTMTLTEDINEDGVYDASTPISTTYPASASDTVDVTLTLAKI